MQPMARRAINIAPASDERTLWSEAVRDVTPLRGRRTVAVAMASPNEPVGVVQSAPMAAHAVPGEPFPGIDRANAERLKRGLHRIEARLDLHGRTLAEAHRELTDFVEASYRVGRRCVLIITGRGLGRDRQGVLRHAVPRWLGEAELRRRILAVARAQPRHGGGGAVYLLLRRQR
jgi:DNA-nicking Smr family endonuclease